MIRGCIFGLGEERVADVEVVWPSGKAEKYARVAADQLVVIKEGTGIVPGAHLPKK